MDPLPPLQHDLKDPFSQQLIVTAELIRAEMAWIPLVRRIHLSTDGVG